MLSLNEIERTLAKLWLDKTERDNLAKGFGSESINPELLNQLDLAGVNLYGNLINFGHNDLMSSIFPYCKKILAKQWDKVVADYFRRYEPDHYHLNSICRHFSEYLLKYGEPDILAKFPYLVELADYEWFELVIQESSEIVLIQNSDLILNLENMSTYGPLLNQTLVLRKYEYPIADIADHFALLSINNKNLRKKFKKQACNLCIYRDTHDHKVRFIELGDAAFSFVEMSQKETLTYKDLLEMSLKLCAEIPVEKAVIRFLELIEEFQEDNLFVGSKYINREKLNAVI